MRSCNSHYNTVEHLRKIAVKACNVNVSLQEASSLVGRRAGCYLVRLEEGLWQLSRVLPTQAVLAWIYYDASGDAIMCWQAQFDGIRLVPPTP